MTETVLDSFVEIGDDYSDDSIEVPDYDEEEDEIDVEEPEHFEPERINQNIMDQNRVFQSLPQHVRDEFNNENVRMSTYYEPRVIRVLDVQNAAAYYIRETPYIPVSFMEFVVFEFLPSHDYYDENLELISDFPTRAENFVYTASQIYGERYLQYPEIHSHQFARNPRADGSVDNTFYL